jgi:hypothetical protein
MAPCEALELHLVSKLEDICLTLTFCSKASEDISIQPTNAVKAALHSGFSCPIKTTFPLLLSSASYVEYVAFCVLVGHMNPLSSFESSWKFGIKIRIILQVVWLLGLRSMRSMRVQGFLT